METKDLIHAYLLLALPKANDLLFRPGYYAIAEIRTVRSKYNQESVIAKGFYSHSPTFTPFIDVEFRLNPLRNKVSEGPKSLFLENLIDTIIKINNVELVNYEINGKPSGSYKVDWEFIGGIEEVVNHHRLKEHQDKCINLIMNSEASYDEYLKDELEAIVYENLFYDESDGLLYDNYVQFQLSDEENGIVYDETITMLNTIDEDNILHDKHLSSTESEDDGLTADEGDRTPEQ